ncbi:MAG: murein biosynthesis integral membrane protein MurJ [Gammaproteobacteria bacterium]
MSIKLLKSTLTVGSMTLLSRIFGLLRDITLANVFGVSGGTDAFLIAFKIPNFMRRLFAEGAFSQAFVPVFSEYKEKHSLEALRDLVDHVAGSLGTLLLLITVLGSIASPLLVYLFAPGFWDEPIRFQLTADMLRITFPYLFFIALVAFAGGILNSYNKFAVPAFTPIILNLCLIAAALWLAPLFDIPLMALAWGVAAAGVLQLLLQFPSLVKLHLFPKPRLKRHHEGVSRILRLMLPAVVGSSVAQINLLLDTIIASFLTIGSVTWLYYSDRMLEFPLGVLGIAIATVILPALSRQHANASRDSFNQTLDWALKLVLLIALPAGIGLLILAGPILATLFQHGDFAASDTRMASLSLMAYVIGLPAFILIKVLAPGYYSRQDTKTPVKIAIIAMLSNMVLNILFVVPMVMLQYEAPHVGLALATSSSGYINAILLYRGLRRSGVYAPLQGWVNMTVKMLVALACMSALVFYLTPGLEIWTWLTPIERVLYLGSIIGLALLVYVAMLWFSGVRPAKLKRA